MLGEGTLSIVVWWENTCDTDYEIVDSNGFSLEVLKEINKEFSNLNWGGYMGKQIVVKPFWVEPQIGDYTSPNIESEGYWDYELLEKVDI